MSTETSVTTESPEAIVADLTRASLGSVVVLGIATIIAGLLAVVAPFVAGASVTVLVAILMVAAGIARTIFAFKAESWGKGILAFFLGVITVFVGLFLFARPMMAMATLTLLLIAYFFADGIFEVIAAFKMRPLKGWGWMVFSGIASVVLGFMLAYEWPASSLWAIGVLVGIRLIFSGWSIIAIGRAGDAVVGEAARAQTT